MKKSLIAALPLFAALSAAHSAYAAPTYFSAPSCYDSNFQPIACHIDVQNFGGPIMTGTTDVYNIWYGDWSSHTEVQDNTSGFFSDLTGSDYMNIANVYGASNTINFKGNVSVGAYLGNSLQDSDLTKIVNYVTAPNNQFGVQGESNALYFIYTAPGITEQSDDAACGFHGDTRGADPYKFAWIGNKYMNPNSGCGGASFADNINATVSHEMFEALTDPLVGQATTFGPPLGFYDNGGTNQGEIGDMCNQSTFKANLNGNSYWVQSIYVNDKNYADGGFCASGNPADVPEPGSVALFGAAVAAVAVARRRNK